MRSWRVTQTCLLKCHVTYSVGGSVPEVHYGENDLLALYKLP